MHKNVGIGFKYVGSWFSNTESDVRKRVGKNTSEDIFSTRYHTTLRVYVFHRLYFRRYQDVGKIHSLTSSQHNVRNFVSNTF
ncbi:hypothetical protein IC582_020880 [Cucumis melo]